MKQVKWFDRKFEFATKQNIFPSIMERLEGTPLRLNNKIKYVDPGHLTIRFEDKWSIQENIGHLLDLEPLWRGRLEDILSNKEFLRPADLENQKTDLARHNEKDISDLLDEFLKLRNMSLENLQNLSEEEIFKHALHPRLKTTMRITDLFLFVAEHDDHHLARISEISKQLVAKEH